MNQEQPKHELGADTLEMSHVDQEKIIELLHELNTTNSLPEPKSEEDKAKIAKIHEELAQHKIDPNNVPDNIKTLKEKHQDGHGHGHHEDSTFKKALKRIGGVSAIGGGLFAGLITWAIKMISETATGKKDGGGHGGGGGGGHGGGGHH